MTIEGVPLGGVRCARPRWTVDDETGSVEEEVGR
jgi:hypothetical protein